MITCLENNIRKVASERPTYDPTHTTTIRNAFARNAGGRFSKLRGLIRRALIDQDCFGMIARPTIMKDMSLPNVRQFDFPRSAEKIEAFMNWLEDQVRLGILDVEYRLQYGRAIEEPWTNLYIRDSYFKGVLRARYEMIGAGYDVPTIEATGGLSFAMMNPMHVDRIGLLFTRTYRDLKGITDVMDMQISRILAQGMADGMNPRELARILTRTINGPIGDLGITDVLGRFIPAERRAKMLARTEVIRAHHQAMIQEYRNWQIFDVWVKAELVTAGDTRVCEECQNLSVDADGNRIVYTLDEIESMIPVHTG